MARERVDTSQVRFPELFVNGEYQFVLPMDHIRTKKDEEKALDLIAEMKKREGPDFYKQIRHRKLRNRSLPVNKLG